jgi:hypothetical protein
LIHVPIIGPMLHGLTPVTSELMPHELRLGVEQHCVLNIVLVVGSSDASDAVDAVPQTSVSSGATVVRVMRQTSLTTLPKKVE